MNTFKCYHDNNTYLGDSASRSIEEVGLSRTMLHLQYPRNKRVSRILFWVRNWNNQHSLLIEMPPSTTYPTKIYSFDNYSTLYHGSPLGIDQSSLGGWENKCIRLKLYMRPVHCIVQQCSDDTDPPFFMGP